jgi:YVTN family beta-propeller protein
MRIRRSHTSSARRRRLRRLTVGTLATGLVAGLSGVAVAAQTGSFGTARVDGTPTAAGVLLPDNQWVRPAGQRALVTNGRLLSSGLSPDGHTVAAITYLHGTGFLTLTDAATGTIRQQVGTGTKTDPKLGSGSTKGQVGTDGPLYSADGKSLFFPLVSSVLRFTVHPDGTVAPSPVSIPVPDATLPGGTTSAALPAGMAQSPDGGTLYVALNGANTLGVVDLATNTLTRQIPVGNAPRQVVLTGGQAFVSNEAGRPATAGEFTNLTDNTPAVADPSTGAASTGSISVVDLAAGAQATSIGVGLQPTAEFLAPDGTLFVANSNDDSFSMIDTATRKVVQTVNVNPLPGSTVGSSPNAITLVSPNQLAVSIGRDNAIAAYRYNGPTQPLQYEGLVPTDWYPVNVVYDRPLGRVIVTNDKGIGAHGAPTTVTQGPNTNPATGHNTYNDTGSFTSFPLPALSQLAGYTKQVFQNNDWEKLLSEKPLTANAAKATPTAIPAQLGMPSTIKHVFLLVKENRTYDQVLGDIGKGNSDPSLVQFGASTTPNQHALANQFGLFDNFYDEGTLSADGHNWLMQADANDYIEKEFGAFYRSYPAQGGDALAYQRDGFLWNAAQNAVNPATGAHNTAADFGEYANFQTLPATNAPTWSQWYQASRVQEGKAAGPSPIAKNQYPTYSDIPSLNAIIDTAYPKFNTDIPDQYRADIWEQAFAKQLASPGGVPNLNMLWVPQDHTAGTSGTDPYPSAMVADNDLAVGRILSDISHSSIWSSSAVFVVEDDPQAGVDHVDGHRSTMFIASPYAKRGVVNSTYYTQLNLVKTMEQILGIPPMNQEDRAATPMTDAFTNTPDFAPFTTLPNQIPLTYGLKAAPATAAPAEVAASTPAAVPAAQQPVAQQWAAWSDAQHFGGAQSAPDRVNPAQLNRLDWYTVTNWSKPYPGDSAIYAPADVPGANRPSGEIG